MLQIKHLFCFTSPVIIVVLMIKNNIEVGVFDACLTGYAESTDYSLDL